MTDKVSEAQKAPAKADFFLVSMNARPTLALNLDPDPGTSSGQVRCIPSRGDPFGGMTYLLTLSTA